MLVDRCHRLGSGGAFGPMIVAMQELVTEDETAIQLKRASMGGMRRYVRNFRIIIHLMVCLCLAHATH